MTENIVTRKVHIFGDNISTDLIIPGKYKFKFTNAKELAKHAMEGVDPDFSKKARKGDVIVGGENFGCGSSREQAPLALTGVGIKAVIAKSFARIFYRNAINLGLSVIESREIVEGTKQGDILEINLKEKYIKNLRSNKTYIIQPLPNFLQEMLEEAGLLAYYRKYGRLPWRI